MEYVALWVVFSIVAIFSGPFGTYTSCTLAERLLLWPPIVALLVVGMYTAKLSMRMFQPNLSYWAHTLSASALFALFFLLVLVIAMPIADLHPAMYQSGKAMIASAVLISLSLHLMVLVLRDRGQGDSAEGSAETAAHPAALPRIMRRLPADLQGQLIRITVRDHYVDIHTDQGVGSVLMRFRDATQEAEEDGLNGFCSHRSHWVMRDAIKGTIREGGRLFLVLSDGSTVPVSRKYRPNVEAAGLI